LIFKHQEIKRLTMKNQGTVKEKLDHDDMSFYKEEEPAENIIS
jgi:hypothetical protein